ncbi:MAG TPA: hypothetical protein VIP06_02805 [Nocardioides sp.]
MTDREAQELEKPDEWGGQLPWHPRAASEAEQIVRGSVRELRDEAERITRRARAEMVAPHYVRQAGERVGMHVPSGVADVLLQFGCLLVGVGLGLFGSAWFTPSHGGVAIVLIAAALVVVGVIPAAVGGTMKWVKN